MSERPSVLIVDDMPDNIDLAADILKERYEIYAAIDGERAFKVLAHQSIDLILLDVMMPHTDGFEVCRKLKSDKRYRRIPVIFLTALDSRDNILRGLELGAYYYLTKPVDCDQLHAVAASATEGYRTYKRLRQEDERTLELLKLLEQGRFVFRTLHEARYLAVLIAKAFPDPERCVLGLTELMINAVEHGNLNISYEEKSRLNEQGGWQQEVERRLSLPEYAGKTALLKLERDDKEIRAMIQDQGSGFDWQRYLEIDPDRAFDTHGRGIAMSKALCFDRLDYLNSGNQVLATVFISDPNDAVIEEGVV